MFNHTPPNRRGLLFQHMENQLTELSVSYKPKKAAGPMINSSSDAYQILKDLFNADQIELREEFIALYLNRANRLKGWCQISVGGISGTIADPRLILSVALKTASSAIVLAHNHPSGNYTPSEEDLRLTKKIDESCRLLDIKLLDHLILTRDGYSSFADEGRI